MTVRAGALLLVLLLAAPVTAGDIEVIVVRNRPASDLVPVLEPLAGPGGTVTSLENRLIVRASPQALARIKALAQELDVAPRMLWITVRQTLDRSAAERSGAVTGSVGAPAAPGSSATVTRSGATVETRTSRTVVTGSLGASSVEESGADVQRIRVLEGRPAFIRTGRAVPVPQAGVLPTQAGPVVVAGTAYAEADTGFYVTPHLAGRTVTLEIATSKDALDAHGAARVQRVATAVSATVGEWISIGGVGRELEARSAGTLSEAVERASERAAVQLKVDAADEAP